jgi:hypothetical protein
MSENFFTINERFQGHRFEPLRSGSTTMFAARRVGDSDEYVESLRGYSPERVSTSSPAGSKLLVNIKAHLPDAPATTQLYIDQRALMSEVKS